MTIVDYSIKMDISINYNGIEYKLVPESESYAYRELHGTLVELLDLESDETVIIPKLFLKNLIDSFGMVS